MSMCVRECVCVCVRAPMRVSSLCFLCEQPNRGENPQKMDVVTAKRKPTRL